MKTMRKRLGDVLVGWGAITTDELRYALTLQHEQTGKERRRLGRILLEQQKVTEIMLAEAIAEAHGLPFKDLAFRDLDHEVARMVPQRVAERALVLPMTRNEDGLVVAVADPLDVVGLDDLRVVLGATPVQLVVSPESQIRRRLEAVWSTVDALQPNGVAEKVAGGQDEIDDEEDIGAIGAVQRILELAVRSGASDVHVEPFRERLRVRMRIDGIMRPVMSLPPSTHSALTSRIKIVGSLDIAEKRRPQDGRATIRVGGIERSIRVSSLPTIHGEKIVVRLLPDIGDVASLGTLGMPPEHLQRVHRLLGTNQGLMLITGPTGSGKSTTLYSAIWEVVTGERNVVTVEDPVEIEIPGVTQVQVNEKAGLGFPEVLRSVMRQDPDIVMVGEIRDQETAQMAIRAAMTGHLVLSTVHTNDAASAVLRLSDMGVPRHLVAASLSLAISQRLVRRPCRACSGPATVDRETKALLGLTDEQAVRMVAGHGCSACEGLGYRGRVGIYEVLPVTSTIRTLLLDDAPASVIRAAAAEQGHKSLLEAGIEAAVQGRTTPAELLRVLFTGEQ